MTPSSTPLPIYKGARFEHTLTFYESDTNNVIDLTGLEPFTATISHSARDEVLITLAVSIDDPSSGQIVITATPEQTDTLKLGTARLGLQDSFGNPYIASVCPVLFFSHP